MPNLVCMNKENKKKILLVEDDPTQAMMYQTAFNGAGYRALVAATGRQGIELAKKEKPDLIFLDVLLGDLNGTEVLKELKADPATKELKAVMLSNLNKEELKAECRRLGALDFLLKMQFLPKEIIAKIEEYLRE